MKINIKTKFGRTNLKAKLLERMKPKDAALNQIGSEGVVRLSESTPKDTGELAQSWNYKVLKDNTKTEIIWFNTGHPEVNVNLVHLLHYGHYTRNKGYVPPTNFLDKPIDEIRNIINKTKVVGNYG